MQPCMPACQPAARLQWARALSAAAAAHRRVRRARPQVEGMVEEMMPEAAEGCGVNLLGVALAGHVLPPHVLGLMRNSKGAVLVHRTHAVSGGSGAARAGGW